MSKSQSMNERRRVQISFPGDGRTKQSFVAECNVNTIMKKYQQTGLIKHVDQHGGEYGDFTNVQDYQSSLNQIILANDMFMSLPSNLRARFSNDPAQFLHFVGDPANRDEMMTLGLLKKEVIPPVVVPLSNISTENPATE